jgi:K+ transporter
VLLLTVVLATAMVVGDGILTPSISMLGAVAGLHVATDGFISEGESILQLQRCCSGHPNAQ